MHIPTPGNINGRNTGYTGTRPIVEATGNYTVEPQHGGGMIRCTQAANDVFVTLTATVGPGFFLDIMADGATSTVQFDSADGVIIRSRGGRLQLVDRYSVARAECVAPGEWVISGDVETGA